MNIAGIKHRVRRQLHLIAKKTFKFKCNPFPSIISNDCFGGEIYRSLGIPYNTPFVGLMMMAPCYVKLLKNLDFYLDQDIQFVTESKYESVNKLMGEKNRFPIATLNNEVEIQFLHYHSEAEARQKWETRKKRIDRNNLLVKLDFSKDYSDEACLQEFLSLNYAKKIAIGSSQKDNVLIKGNMIDLPEYATDATILFKLSLKYINYRDLLKTGVITRPSKMAGLFISRFLNNTLAS